MSSRGSYLAAYGILAIAIVALVGYFIWKGGEGGAGVPAQNVQTIGPITFACDAGKTIQATFYNPQSGTSTAALSLSDGRTLTLPQTISGSGARYANNDETVVFWNKGNTAFIEEGNTNVNNPPMTYKNCVQLAPDPTGQLNKWYADPQGQFSIRYPAGFSIDTNYQYQELGPGKSIAGVKFTILGSMASSTNLAPDTYLSVELLPRMQDCQATLFLGSAPPPQTITDSGTTYSVASTTGAAAGNRYEEWVYALPGTNPCIAVRYFIHYGVIENYPPGSVEQFDEGALLQQFDAIRKSLIIGQ